MILLIDNYDSFSYNLYQLIGSIDPDIRVVRNDELTVEDIEKLDPQAIILSPGPGRPCDAGICEETVKHFAGKNPDFRSLSRSSGDLRNLWSHGILCQDFDAWQAVKIENRYQQSDLQGTSGRN